MADSFCKHSSQAVFLQLCSIIQESKYSELSLQAGLEAIEDLKHPPISRSNPHQTIAILLSEWNSLKNIIKCLFNDRMSLLKEKSELIERTGSYKTIDLAESSNFMEAQCSLRSSDESLIQTQDFTEQLTEDITMPIFKSFRPNERLQTVIDEYFGDSVPRQKKRRSSGSTIMQEGELHTSIVNCFTRNISIK